jgi:hypothetical protein
VEGKLLFFVQPEEAILRMVSGVASLSTYADGTTRNGEVDPSRKEEKVGLSWRSANVYRLASSVERGKEERRTRER